MSPEQALGEPATPRSDLYSLGVVLYEALTGELPFTADNPIAVSMKHVTEALRPPREIDPTIPEGMNALIVKLMAKDPEDRYASAGELADDLRRVSRGLPPAAVGKLPRPRTQRTAVAQNPTGKMPSANPAPLRRRRSLPWLLIAVAAILLFLGTLGVLQALGPNATNGWFDVFGADKNPPDKPSAPQQVRVPEVAGLTRGEAQQRLIDEGLEVGEITSFPSERIAVRQGHRAGLCGGYSGRPGHRGEPDRQLRTATGPRQRARPRSSASAQPSPGARQPRPAPPPRPSPPGKRTAASDSLGPGRTSPGPTYPKPGQQSPPAREPNGAAPEREPADDSGPQGRGENSGQQRRTRRGLESLSARRLASTRRRSRSVLTGYNDGREGRVHRGEEIDEGHTDRRVRRS